MLYSGSHAQALIRLYSAMFSEPPELVMQAAGASGKIQPLLGAMDQAANDGVPIKDWTPFAKRSSGTPLIQWAISP